MSQRLRKDQNSGLWFLSSMQSRANVSAVDTPEKSFSEDFDSNQHLEGLVPEEIKSSIEPYSPLLVASRNGRASNYSKSYSSSHRAGQKSKFSIQSCKCPKVLIVDDDAFNLTALELHLIKLDIPCDTAFNGQIAFNKILHRQNTRCSQNCQQYLLIFMDYNMPVMDGLETTKKLRKKISNREIDDMNIVCCTAFVQQSELDKTIQAGMNSYCTKPITLEIVKQKLKEYAPSLLLARTIDWQ